MRFITYQNSIDHLMDEINLLEIYLGYAVIKFRNNLKQEDKQKNEFTNLYISDEQIDSILITNIKDSFSSSKQLLPFESQIKQQIANKRAEINKKINQSVYAGIELPLEHIVRVFSLSEFEKFALLVCIAPEIDSKFERLYAYLQDDISKKKSTVELILNLFFDNTNDKISSRALFSYDKPLFKFDLIRFEQQQNNTQNPHLLTKPLHVDDHIINFILNKKNIEINFLISKFSSLSFPSQVESNIITTHKENEKRLDALFNNFTSTKNVNSFHNYWYLTGESGVGKKSLVQNMCKKYNLPLLLVDVESLLNYYNVEQNYVNLPEKVFRESLLQNAVLYFNNFDLIFDSQQENPKIDTKIISRLQIELTRNTNAHKGLMFFSGQKSWQHDIEISIMQIQFDKPNNTTQKKLWENILRNEKCYCPDMTNMINEITSKYDLTSYQIKNAIIFAKNKSRLETINDEKENKIKLTKSNLYEGCKMQSTAKLDTHAKLVNTKYTIDDIVLSEDKRQQLQEIIEHAKNKNVVYHDWNFKEKVSQTNGLNILFAGESGTGKTMAASIIANELGLPIYKIDLSSIVSKYIGETEKNIDKIFKDAENSNALLFFDEADALFGKRSETTNAHDRYANIEVNYLLQKLESHNKTVILASNFTKNIDSAFVRRMSFWIEFSFPDEDNRLQIWQNIFPDEAPLDKDINFEFMAKNFRLTGGNIKNIALSAAFYAASEKPSCISMKHLVLATKKELEKIGIPVTRNDFGKYYEFIK